MRLATESRDGTGIAKLAGGQVPFICLAHDRVYYAVALPPSHVVRVFLQRLRNVAFGGSLGVDAHDAFALLLCVLNLPVHPFAILRFRRDVNEKRTCPADLGSKDLRLDDGTLGASLGMVPLPGRFFIWLVFILLAYAALAQAVKTWFVRRYGYN